MHTCKVVFSVPRNKKMFSSQLQVGEKKGKESHWGVFEKKTAGAKSPEPTLSLPCCRTPT